VTIVSVHSFLPLTYSERRKIGMGRVCKRNLLLSMLSDREGRKKSCLTLIEKIALF